VNKHRRIRDRVNYGRDDTAMVEISRDYKCSTQPDSTLNRGYPSTCGGYTDLKPVIWAGIIAFNLAKVINRRPSLGANE
jgi:hypothetical protein